MKEALEFLEDNPPESARDALLKLVESDDPIISGMAASALGNLKYKGAIEKIASLLDREIQI